MWNPIRIKFQNLFAHIDSEYEFNNGICTVVSGVNKDAADSNNNGAGKTTIFEAIAIALTNKPLRDEVDKESFINDNAESCYIEFELENPVLKESLKIERKFFRGNHSAKVAIFENGEQNKQVTSVNEANKRIFDLIGIGREDLLRYFIISQDNNYTFFTAGDVEKKEVLNRITSADMINPVLNNLSEKQKILSSASLELNAKLSSLQEKLDFFKEQKIQTKVLSDEEAIKDLNDNIDNEENEIVNNNKKKDELNSNLSDIKDKIKDLNLEIQDDSVLKNNKKELEEKEEKLSKMFDENKSVLREIKSALDSTVECPNCGHEFMLDNNLNLSKKEAEEAKKAAEQENKDISKKIKSIDLQLNEIKKNIRLNDRRKEDLDSLDFKQKSIKDKISSIDYYIKSCESSIEKFKNKIEETRKNNNNFKIIEELDKKIKQKENDIKDINERIKGNSHNLDMVNFWIYYMGKNGFMTYLANNAVKIIEGITNSYLRKFNSNLSVEINGYKILKDKSVREKIDIKVMNNGMNAKVFMGMSGGERDRINIAGILGIQHLINMSSNGRGLNLLLLDESLGFIDAEGTLNVIKTLNSLKTTILMITQNVEDTSIFSNILRVEKKDGISKIINN
jgi:DNA repair exonuclease SbcCD ATPase subunit